MRTMLALIFIFAGSFAVYGVSPVHKTYRWQVDHIALNKNGPKQIGDYSKPISDEEKKNINYIINTLSSRSMFGLLGAKKKLEEAGEKTEHINPLKHLEYIFSNPELKARTKKIDKVPWNRYVGDFEAPLNQALDEGKINDKILKEFSEQVNVPYETLKPLVDNREWGKFMNTLRDS